MSTSAPNTSGIQGHYGTSTFPQQKIPQASSRWVCCDARFSPHRLLPHVGCLLSAVCRSVLASCRIHITFHFVTDIISYIHDHTYVSWCCLYYPFLFLFLALIFAVISAIFFGSSPANNIHFVKSLSFSFISNKQFYMLTLVRRT